MRIGSAVLVFLAFATVGDGITLRELASPNPEPQRLVYKKDLSLFVFRPNGRAADERLPAVVWIHGGGWTSGDPAMFFPHARYTAQRGAVGIVIQYRLIRAGGPTVADSLADCKSAIRFIRSHAAELRVDPNKIAAAGDSAGGHLAAALGTIAGFDDPLDDRSVSAVPNALVLYNPIVDLTEGGWSTRVPQNTRQLSPRFQVRPGLPPMLLLHGLQDTVVSPDQAREFAEAMRRAGNQCELKLVENARHAFAIPDYSAPERIVVQAIRDADEFLGALGYFEGAPTLETLAPLPVSRESASWWRERHKQILTKVGQGNVDLLMIGDSITQNYEKFQPPYENFKPVWDEFYAPRKALNLGYSGDTTANVMWRLEHGEVDGIQPKAAVILIGTNDTAHGASAEQTSAGIEEVVRALHVKLPACRIVLVGILPSRVSERKSAVDLEVNRYLGQKFRKHSYVTYLDIGQVFLKDSVLNTDMFYDPHLTPPRGPLHPDTVGQRRMAEAIEPALGPLIPR